MVRKPDRAFALQLFARGVPFDAVENAFVLAAARRAVRGPRRRAVGRDPLAGLLLSGH